MICIIIIDVITISQSTGANRLTDMSYSRPFSFGREFPRSFGAALHTTAAGEYNAIQRANNIPKTSRSAPVTESYNLLLINCYK